MILQALTAYYEALLRQGKLSAPGWDDAFKVSFMLEVGDDGSLLDVIDCRETVQQGKKQVVVPRLMGVPAHAPRSSGVAANFLCDNASYMLGADEKGKPERAKQCFVAAAELHHQLLDQADTPAAKAVLAFFDSWKPAEASAHPLLKDRWKEVTGNANFVFAYDYADGRREVTEDFLFREAWQRYYQSEGEETTIMQCLITGEQAPLEKTHPFIKGVDGSQSSGASLVSFNGEAFGSYGHKQGENAPVSKYAAFAYTTALNTLLRDWEHKRKMGDTTVVCWAENADETASELGMLALFDDFQESDSGLREEDVRLALKQLAKGESCAWAEKVLRPDQHLYFLGLAPNAARLSVRFFVKDSLQSFSRHIEAHQQALEIVRPANDNRCTLSLASLTWETVNKSARNPAPAPQLGGDLLRAVLNGGRYPATLLNGVTLRIRAEKYISRGRAAILKAYYTRNETELCPKEVLTVELNEQSCYLPYVLGRLFSVLEAVQNAANPSIGTTIKDRYFNAACATPAVVFPTLLKLAQKHLQKLSTGNEIYYSKQIAELMGKIRQEFPARMTLPEQGAFEIGYYHQTQKRFEKKN